MLFLQHSFLDKNRWKEYNEPVSYTHLDVYKRQVFVEPEACARHYEALEMLRLEEENEVRRILYTLTGMVYDFREDLERDIQVMEKVDLMFSRGKLSLAYGGVEPSVNAERRIVLKDGRHPLMDRAVSVPLQFRLGNVEHDEAEAVRGIVITGPNTGGKLSLIHI